jgi:alpha-galactosidase
MINRRHFFGRLLAASSVLPAAASAAGAAPQRTHRAGTGAAFDLTRPPDLVTVFTEDEAVDLQAGPGDVWRKGGLEVRAARTAEGFAVSLAAPAAAVLRIRLRWHANLSAVRLFLGDHWERSYGDLEWRGEVPNRVMPWYFMAWDGARTTGAGVATGAGALCFWNADRSGVSLWADLRNGGSGVRLGERVLPVCTVQSRAGRPGESPFAATRAFCRQLCPRPLLPVAPVFGTNDWYYSYGDSRPETLLDTTRLVVSLCPGGAVRPWSVIDDGWSPDGPEKGMWDRGNARFGDMQAFAHRLEEAGARPGIWFRPLLAAQARPQAVRLSRDSRFLDPTLPDVLAIVAEDTRRLRAWGYGLIKHDYSTYDILGRWGFDFGATLTKDGWHFADRSVTTAEVVRRLYRTLRESAGDALLIGCNTFSHLSAGLFEINRIGDDVSGKAWDRTRRMGVNTLAFRAAQHGTFYAADPDIAPITAAHPWDKGRQWLQLLAGSGMPLFVSPERRAVGASEATELKRAFAQAARAQPGAEPLDWLETTCPHRWTLGGRTVTFDWEAAEGPWPLGD